LRDVIKREVEDHGNAVAVLPFDPVQRTALLVRLMRAPALVSAGRLTLLECPAGIVEEADPARTARREVYEEVGLRLNDLEHAGRVWSSLGISMDLYLAPYSSVDRVNTGGGLATEHEDIELAELRLDALWAMAERGEIDDLKTLTLVLTLRIRHPELFGPNERVIPVAAETVRLNRRDRASRRVSPFPALFTLQLPILNNRGVSSQCARRRAARLRQSATRGPSAQLSSPERH
jgi:nudix-type nucleoside diphosphatase (YffH/AdpP family)